MRQFAPYLLILFSCPSRSLSQDALLFSVRGIGVFGVLFEVTVEGLSGIGRNSTNSDG